MPLEMATPCMPTRRASCPRLPQGLLALASTGGAVSMSHPHSMHRGLQQEMAGSRGRRRILRRLRSEGCMALLQGQALCLALPHELGQKPVPLRLVLLHQHLQGGQALCLASSLTAMT